MTTEPMRQRPDPRATVRVASCRPRGGPDGYAAFHPRPLPPDPPLAIDPPTQTLIDRSNQSLGRLDGVTLLLPDPDLFLYAFVRKEAVPHWTRHYNERRTHSALGNRTPLTRCSGGHRARHLAHAQFETIHPFLDGNGRVGRLLITLLLCSEGVMRRPLLYLSLYFKRNRDAYYDHLQRVRLEGAWEAWLRFFLEAVVEVADSTTDTTRRIVQLVERDRQAIQSLGRAAGTALRVHDRAVR